MLNKKNQINKKIYQCHSGQPTHVILNLIQDLNRDAECPQHDNRVAQSGRSMVEMLGVLAVIGVLTVIGIAGFRVALNKHDANQTVERLMRRAVVVAGQANFGQNLSLHEFDANDGEYPITLLERTDNESFTMRADNVPNEVCQQIVGLDWKLAKIIPEDCSDTSMKFKFLNELTDCSTCQPESVDCPPESEMQCGTCSVVRGFLDNDDDCAESENGQYCVRGHCAPCNDGYAGSPGQCRPCNIDGSISKTSGPENQHNCLKTMIYNLGNKTMYGCNYNDTITNAEEYSCKECPNRCYMNGTCYRAGPGQAHQRVSETDGTCQQ